MLPARNSGILAMVAMSNATGRSAVGLALPRNRRRGAGVESITAAMKAATMMQAGSSAEAEIVIAGCGNGSHGK